MCWYRYEYAYCTLYRYAQVVFEKKSSARNTVVKCERFIALSVGDALIFNVYFPCMSVVVDSYATGHKFLITLS